ncbi:MAG: PQQ-dependent sugar dehydrogenase [Pirellulaceae bacterium]|jgi:glucose/arabinose dehydrogenase|nr:PQQ-dependent sugar dehydrogenase [Pirellulaceae bacterium]MDP7017982.1 PQQ-dependent sugar dehydrogenase [Pirellulaceae bacterium]
MKTEFVLATFAAVALIASSSARGADLNSLSQAEKRAGWKLVFDGKTTKGWRGYKKDKPGEGWKIVDGALTRAAGGAGDIMTDAQYGSFELSLEYKISKGGNSGIMFHVLEDARGAPWSGPEVQVQDNVDGHDPQKSGWMYQLYRSPVDSTKPAGQWNHLQLKVTPEEGVLYMNGVRYYRFKKGDADWDRRVAKSKFASTEGWAKATEGHIALQDHGNMVAYRNIKIREFKSGATAPDPVDGKLALKPVVAFPNVQWAGWKPVDDNGRPQPFRPIVLTFANDGMNRIFVATQRGVLHVLPNDDDAKKSEVFLDISDKVSYSDRQNEEGLLGLTFHPNYKQNGEFYIYYTTTGAEHTSVISRFRVSPDDPNLADAKFEEEIMRIKQPYWNHNGGTIEFGPDGKLYVALGDGGAGNDPHGNGQNLGTLLGSILRIDVDKKSGDKAYSIPRTNPFVGREGARGEIWAYGVRNIWRLAFDRETASLWAADVGQNLWEEINIIKRGGNYGWNIREGGHPFGQSGVDTRDGLVEPVWEYDHEVGKSITGGVVYRGKKLPELAGAYVYGDYVSGRLWALKIDSSADKKVTNWAIPSQSALQPISFGEDADGEIYFTVVTPTGKGVYRFARTD